MKKKRLIEIRSGITFDSGDVDEKTKTIKDVVLLGRTSFHRESNGKQREYSDTALRDAVRLFEGANTFVDHRKKAGSSREPHPVANLVGTLHGLKIVDEKVKASEWKIVNEQWWPLAKGIAEHQPKGVGFSIDAFGQVKGNSVVSIEEARSVDLVVNPATTQSLFEQETNDMDWDDVKLDDLKEHCTDLLEEFQKPVKDELAKLKEGEKEKEKDETTLLEQVQELKQRLEEQRLEALVLQEIREAKVEVSSVQLKALHTLDEDDRKTFLEEIGTDSKKPRSFSKDKGKSTKDLTESLENVMLH